LGSNQTLKVLVSPGRSGLGSGPVDKDQFYEIKFLYTILVCA